MACNGDCANCGISKESNFYATYDGFKYDDSYAHPYVGIMNLTDECTNACPYCFVRFNKNRAKIDTVRQACEFLINNASLSGQEPMLTFFGGEPLIMFEEIIKPIVEEYFGQIKFNITTNGVLLTKEKVDFFTQYEIPILLSFDGVKEVQDYGRPLVGGGSSYEVIIQNIPYAVEKMGDNIVMRSTLTKQALPYLYDTFLLAQSLGFTSWSFAMNAFEEWYKDDTEVLIKQLDLIAHDISIALQKNLPVIKVNTINSEFVKIQDLELNPSYEIDNRLFRCGMATTGTGIDCFGNIVPCQEKNSSYTHIIGNVWEGIDKEKHQEYLQKYMDTMQRWNCYKSCPDKIKAICLNDICPSRVEDLGKDTPATATCAIHTAMHKVVTRLYLKYGLSANPYIREYFGYHPPVMEVSE